jgi:hypothetical protein
MGKWVVSLPHVAYSVFGWGTFSRLCKAVENELLLEDVLKLKRQP